MPQTERERLALDRASVRTIDPNNGHLHVAQSSISKATVNGYLGREIPRSDELGLKPDKLYMLLRDPVELEKAAASFNAKPLVSVHKPMSADEHPHELVVGSVNNVTWSPPYLQAELVVWDGDSIDAIDDGTQRELSCGYYYDFDPTPGTYNGVKYDGRQIDIRGDHVALVREGRAGPDVFVGDEKPNSKLTTKDKPMRTQRVSPMSRRALFASAAMTAMIRPKLAADAKVDLSKAFSTITAKNWQSSKPRLVRAINAAARGKLATDASLEDVTDMLDQLDDMVDEMDPAAVDMDDDADDGTMDADPDTTKVSAFLTGKLSPEDLATVMGMLGDTPAPTATDAENPFPEKKEVSAKDADKPAVPPVSKAAMDAAIAQAAKLAADTAEKNTVARLMAIRDAENDVRPHVGELVIAQDSAADVYRLALDTLSVDHAGITEIAALKALLKMVPKPGSVTVTPADKTGHLAMDAAQSAAFAKRFPHANRLIAR